MTKFDHRYGYLDYLPHVVVQPDAGIVQYLQEKEYTVPESLYLPRAREKVAL